MLGVKAVNSQSSYIDLSTDSNVYICLLKVPRSYAGCPDFEFNPAKLGLSDGSKCFFLRCLVSRYSSKCADITFGIRNSEAVLSDIGITLCQTRDELSHPLKPLHSDQDQHLLR